MKAITDNANTNYEFGQDFNYALWTEGTQVTLTNVPWNNDYRDICSFPDAQGRSLDEYIDSNQASNIPVENVSYIKFNTPIRLSIPFNRAFKFNYLRVQSPIQPIPGNDIPRSFYYFILDVRYVSPNTTEFIIQLDIFQSFRNDFSFGKAFIEKGHAGIANENAFDNFGRDWLTQPEGLDVGGEYQVITHRDDLYMSKTTMDILMASTVSLEEEGGTVTSPKLKSAKGSNILGFPSGVQFYIFRTPEELETFFRQYSSLPWLTQGVVSISAIPSLDRYGYTYTTIQNDNGNSLRKLDSSIYQGKYTKMFVNWRNSQTILNHIPERYRHLKKLLTYPYMVIEMTTFTGTPVILKPESWNNADAEISEKANILPPNQKIVFYPKRYNAKADSKIVAVENSTGNTQYYDDDGDYLDKATFVNNFPQFAAVNNMAMGLLAANANNIAFQNQSADWAQSRALAANQTSYDQNKRAIQTAEGINRIANAGTAAQAANQNQALGEHQMVAGAGGVAIAGAGALLGMTNGSVGLGGVTSAVGNQIIGGIQTGISQAANDRSANTSIAVSRGTNAAQNNQATYVNDTNKGLADWSARGDYANAIAGINAKVQDIALTQPSTSGQVGGEAFNILQDGARLSLRWKLIDSAALKRVGDLWLRYGYAVNVFGNIPENLMVMEKFTYWKLQETYINSSTMPEGFKQIIRGIFEKGVTVWADPSYIGNIDIADNKPIEGYSL